MQSFAELKKDAQVMGLISADESAWIVRVEPCGTDAARVIYKDSAENEGNRTLSQEDLAQLRLAEKNLTWSFAADANDFCLVLEALRIHLGSLFDPMMAVHSANIEPLPHQISAVYQVMLPRRPLRFVLADDPGAGKTIMAGLLIMELLMRSDVRRVLIVAPGSLTEQWKGELSDKFFLDFDLLTTDQSSSDNPFQGKDLLIARMDQLARRGKSELQEKLKKTEWDLIIVDEAHKMSAHAAGSRGSKKTKRYQLGELLGRITRHYLLMTATPHNGSDEDFNLWLSLIDPDRFGNYFPGLTADVSDIMRRLIKEKLLRFDGTPLFPERIATTVQYALSPKERDLYDRVTKYVKEEMDRAERLDGSKRSSVGFALTILQRRLASSPAAIHKSLQRRLERLEQKLADWDKYEKAGERGASPPVMAQDADDDTDEDDYTEDELEKRQDNALSNSAAGTRDELRKEVETLRDLEQQAERLHSSEEDCKWKELSALLQRESEIVADGQRHKLIIFTEHRDTLEYLKRRVSTLLGGDEHVRDISGSTKRDTRHRIQEEFSNDPKVTVLVATDAAGEGINLQCAHLLINYDLPWNPNRLEQRFGRIHRIGQTHTCHMWNMVAKETREGQVFDALFQKLETERQSLGGQVFDILGEAFKNISLEDLLCEAIRRENNDSSGEYMRRKVAQLLDHEELQRIMRQNELVDQTMSENALSAVKAEMDRTEARKMQPYFIRAFFRRAFQSPHINGALYDREVGRYEIPHIPNVLLSFNRQKLHTRTPLAPQYERICFDKEHTRPTARAPRAEFIHPRHPLMQTLTAKVIADLGPLLETGTVLIAPTDDTTEPYLVVALHHTVREARTNKPISQRMHFVKISKSGKCSDAGWSPHLDMAPPAPNDADTVAEVLRQDWLRERDWEGCALLFASAHLAKAHYEEVRRTRKTQVDKILQATTNRMIDARNILHNAAIGCDAQRQRIGTQSQEAREKANELAGRWKRREAELEDTLNIVSAPPIAKSCMLVIPQGYINMVRHSDDFCADVEARRDVENLAMRAVIDAEKALGHIVTDVSAENCGWDITATIPVSQGTPQPDARHIEVKGRSKDAQIITVSSNEVRTALNQGNKFILAIVLVDGGVAQPPRYVLHPFASELQPGQVSGNFSIADLLAKSVTPKESLSRK